MWSVHWLYGFWPQPTKHPSAWTCNRSHFVTSLFVPFGLELMIQFIQHLGLQPSHRSTYTSFHISASGTMMSSPLVIVHLHQTRLLAFRYPVMYMVFYWMHLKKIHRISYWLIDSPMLYAHRWVYLTVWNQPSNNIANSYVGLLVIIVR